MFNFEGMKNDWKNIFLAFFTLLCFGFGWAQFSHSGTTITQSGTETDLSNLLSEPYTDGFSYSSTDGNVNSVISEHRVVGNQGNKIIINGTQTINAKTDLLVMDDYVGSGSDISGADGGYIQINGTLNLFDFNTDADGNEYYSQRTVLKILQQQQNSWGNTGSASNLNVNNGTLHIKGATLETDGRMMVNGASATFILDHGKIIFQQPYSSEGGIWFRQENAGSFIRNGIIEGGSLQTFNGSISIDGITIINAPFGFIFGAATPEIFEIRKYSSVGNEADIPFWSRSNGALQTDGFVARQINMINTDLGTGLKVKGEGATYSYGTIVLFQEYKVAIKDLNGNPIVGGVHYIKSTNNGNRLADDRFANGRFNSINFNQAFVNTGVSDSNGEYEGTYNQDPSLNTSVIVGEYVRLNTDGATSGTVNTGSNQPRKRGKNDTDVFDVHFFAYGYLPATQEVSFKSLDVLDVERVLFADNNISQTDKSIVDAYTEIETLDKLYDGSSSWKVDNVADEYPTTDSPMIAVAGSTLDLGSQNLVIDASASQAFVVDTSTNTITLKANSLRVGDFISIITTGSISVQNGGEILFGYEDSNGKNIFVDFNWGTSDTYHVNIVDLNDNTVIATHSNQSNNYSGTFVAPTPFGSGAKIQLLNTGDNSVFYEANFTDENALSFVRTAGSINDISTETTGVAQHEALFLARKILQKTESMAAALEGTTPTLADDTTTITEANSSIATKENQEAIRALLLRILTKTSASYEALKGAE